MICLFLKNIKVIVKHHFFSFLVPSEFASRLEEYGRNSEHRHSKVEHGGGSTVPVVTPR